MSDPDPALVADSEPAADGWSPRAILFDLDGTLVDSFEPIRDSVNHVRAAHGLPPLCLADVKACVGNGLARLLERTVPDGDPEGDAALFTRHHETVLGTGTRVLPEVRETLEVLVAQGIRLGVCSNKPLTLSQRLLRELGLDPLFAVVLGPESVPNPKPSPDMILRAAALMGEPPSGMLYVGDMSLDVQTARAAGARVWVIASGSETREELSRARPDRIMTRFRDLLDIRRGSVPGRFKE